MKKIRFLLSCAGILFFQIAFSQEKKCCEIPSCKKRAEELAVKITGLAAFINVHKEDRAANKKTLDSLQQANPDMFSSFISTMSDIVKFMNDHRQDLCFAEQLPENISDNVFDWIIYFNDKEHPVKFPSSEFCGGFKKRFEINQGAADIFKKRTAYWASLAGYLVYTFSNKNKCGGKIRLMAGPAFFLKSNLTYVTLNSRLAYRLTDIAPKNFSLGNLNLFAEYKSNFQRFTYASAGIEGELGSFGLNLSVTFDTQTGSPGFLTGIVFSNKKFK